MLYCYDHLALFRATTQYQRVCSYIGVQLTAEVRVLWGAQLQVYHTRFKGHETFHRLCFARTACLKIDTAYKHRLVFSSLSEHSENDLKACLVYTFSQSQSQSHLSLAPGSNHISNYLYGMSQSHAVHK